MQPFQCRGGSVYIVQDVGTQCRGFTMDLRTRDGRHTSFTSPLIVVSLRVRSATSVSDTLRYSTHCVFRSKLSAASPLHFIEPSGQTSLYDDRLLPLMTMHNRQSDLLLQTPVSLTRTKSYPTPMDLPCPFVQTVNSAKG